MVLTNDEDGKGCLTIEDGGYGGKVKLARCIGLGIFV